MLYKDRIRKEITPSRVRALLKLVSRGHYVREELGELLQPSNLNNRGRAEFGMVYNFALDTGLIKQEENNYISLGIERDIVFDDYRYRKQMKEILLGEEDGLFYQITSWVLAQDKKAFKYVRTRDLINAMAEDNIFAKDDEVLSWRFWFKYLGYGHNLKNEFIIPNPFKRIEDLIKHELEFDDKDRVAIRTFMEELVAKAPEFKNSVKGNDLSYPLSIGLRALDRMGKIELTYARDTRDIWHLYNMEHQSLNDISHMKIRG